MPAARARVPLRAASLHRSGVTRQQGSCHDSGTGDARSADIRPGRADRRQGGGDFLRSVVRGRPHGQAAVPGRHGRAAPQAHRHAGGRGPRLSDLPSILPAASALAKRHVDYGARPEHYPVVGAALLWTLERGLGPQWTSEAASAWTAAYSTLSSFMIAEAYGSAQAAE